MRSCCMAAMSLSCRCVARLRIRLACGLSDFLVGELAGAVLSSLLFTWSTSCKEQLTQALFWSPMLCHAEDKLSMI